MIPSTKRLDEMTHEELIDLQASYCDDEDYQSAEDLEQYMNRRFGY